uniref:Uncharacterized protein n=1 Tax=Corethron hystrix TaxID=216773 RepID=A0A6U5JDE0_9STRA|mmetsp:Transcript_36801/g.85959  ORF Transcript_36801/g.85959 Transcript_36801/m.85959 type:complete len:255 (+) Transcript_36801:88-852(+)|eukprot:CAMPEP_0113297596 /NCGR_PEP_ID=MMETSP0010_2-20120614/388_1 /TAXON_ID=216773 ORGANISM="Corethron hystrix, Strain 308" /NCGR_SAMPLE_ID=MMETSP0010_2 /ASSEMBLY_ACC=CAM_ASM_000155 /LENGTH=254 /DNA_ID=CAMNT_0000150503 /DNA_START=86 /DNA_END=850 /DNA_ORIENTATION=+ /assembly_acc=CAM_ASM_000155
MLPIIPEETAGTNNEVPGYQSEVKKKVRDWIPRNVRENLYVVTPPRSNLSHERHADESSLISNVTPTIALENVCKPSRYACVVEGSAASVVFDDLIEWMSSPSSCVANTDPTELCGYSPSPRSVKGFQIDYQDSFSIADDETEYSSNSAASAATSRAKLSHYGDATVDEFSLETSELDGLKSKVEVRMDFLKNKPPSEQIEFLKTLSQRLNKDMIFSDNSKVSPAERDTLRQVITEKLLLLIDGVKIQDYSRNN